MNQVTVRVMANVKSLEGEISFKAHIVRQREKRSINREIWGITSSNFWLDSQIPDYEVGEIVNQCLRNIDQGASFNLSDVVVGGSMSAFEVRKMREEEREAAKKAKGSFRYTEDYDLIEIEFLIDDLHAWLPITFDREKESGNIGMIQKECRQFVPWDEPIRLKHVQQVVYKLGAQLRR